MTDELKRVRIDRPDRDAYVVVGDMGAVEAWRFPRTHEAIPEGAGGPADLILAFGVGGVEYHSRTECDHTSYHEHCDLLNGPCWHDGSSLALNWFARQDRWDDSVFDELERRYADWSAS